MANHGGERLGLAPLLIEKETACFLGSPDVSDFFDLVSAEGKEHVFLESLLRRLREDGISQLELGPVRPDSLVMKDLPLAAERMGWHFSQHQVDVTMEMELPGSFDGFLEKITGKERHEIRRKLRRLYETAQVEVQLVEDPLTASREMEEFLCLFSKSRTDKASFMSPERVPFFRNLAREMTEGGILKLFFLHLNGKNVAGVMCFDHRSTRYLYNNGYDPRYRSLSVGLLSKVLSIKFAIDIGHKRYDFLKGSEVYKSRLGGRPVPLHVCNISAA